jgi:death-on-curing protein
MTEEDILYLHHRLIEDYGGLHGVRDVHRLKSAIYKLSQHDSVTKAAAYFVRDVIQYHPFTDGNKRTAITVMALYLSRHSVKLHCSPEQLENFALDVAAKKYAITDIEQWLLANSNYSRPSNY